MYSLKPEVWSPNAVVQTAPSAIIDHSYVVESLLHIKVMNKADCRPGFNVPFQMDRRHLLPNQLSILRSMHKATKVTYEEVCLTISNLLLLLFVPVPEERCGSTDLPTTYSGILDLRGGKGLPLALSCSL